MLTLFLNINIKINNYLIPKKWKFNKIFVIFNITVKGGFTFSIYWKLWFGHWNWICKVNVNIIPIGKISLIDVEIDESPFK